MNDTARKTANDAADHEQYLTFRLANEEYGIAILCVQEIKGWGGATPLPEAPAHLLGVINLRGTVVPIIDLRVRFGRPATDFGPTTVVIVVRVRSEGRARTVGFVVDAVCEVYTVGADAHRPIPDGVTGGQAFARHLALVDDKLIVLLDVERLLGEAGALDPNTFAHAA